MKKLVLMIGVMIFWVGASQAKVVVGLVDVQKALLAVDEGKQVRTKLENFFKEKQALLKKDEEKFKDLQQKYEKQKSVLNDAAKAGKEKELRDLYVSIQDKTMSYQRELQEMENNLKKPMIDKIRAAAESESKKEDVDITFESSTAPVLYVKERKDLTEAVISEYNKKNPVKK